MHSIDQWPHSEFEIDMNGLTCRHCGKRFKYPKMPRRGSGNWGYGRRGSHRGIVTSVMARHLRAKHPEHAQSPATPA